MMNWDRIGWRGFHEQLFSFLLPIPLHLFLSFSLSLSFSLFLFASLSFSLFLFASLSLFLSVSPEREWGSPQVEEEVTPRKNQPCWQQGIWRAKGGEARGADRSGGGMTRRRPLHRKKNREQPKTLDMIPLASWGHRPALELYFGAV